MLKLETFLEKNLHDLRENSNFAAEFGEIRIF